ncbi:hypothetical protein JNW90_01350 [Micromonospora sp. STR1s_5]|nr:hypothetical protein [Micromonospora sp. STR1s_5]
MPAFPIPRFAVQPVDEVDEKAWNPAQHPRDARGRFIKKERKKWEPNAFAALMDPKSPVTSAVLQQRLADGEGLYADRQKWLRAVNRLNKLADKGEEHPSWPSVKERIQTHKNPAGWVASNLEFMNAKALQAAAIRELERETERRASGSAGMAGARRFWANKDGDAWAKANMPKPDLTEDEEFAIKSYTGAGYQSINGELRTPGSGTPLSKQNVKHLRSAFKKAAAPEDMIVFRGSPPAILNGLGGNLGDPDSMKALVGKTFTSPTFHSTSVGRQAAFNFTEVQWMIRIPKGHPAMYVNRPELSSHDGEREVILNEDTHRVIHGVYRNPVDSTDLKWYVEVEVVPKDWKPGPNWKPQPIGDAFAGYLSKDQYEAWKKQQGS